MYKKTIAVKMVFLLALVFLIGAPIGVLAEEPVCMCFCGTDAGAEQVGELTSPECYGTCGDKGQIVAACAYTFEEYPAQNSNCFSKSECDKYNGTLGEKPAPDCMSGQYYCYYDSAKAGEEFGLAVSIGEVGSVKDLGEYIQVVYTWLMGAALLVAIVLTMVGGIQYVLAAGGASSTQKAVERMKNSAVGLILLLSVHFILVIVNPAFVELDFNKVPLVKKVGYAPTTSCEYLEGNIAYASKTYTVENGMAIDSPYADPNIDGYEIEYTVSNAKCGNYGQVKVDPSGAELPEGTVCAFEYCEDEGDRCIGDGASAACLSCADATSNNIQEFDKTTCSFFEKRDIVDSTGGMVQASYCNFGDGVFSAAYGGLSTTQVCIQVDVSCPTIASCRSYDDVWGYHHEDDKARLDHFNSEHSSNTFYQICEDDPCGVGPCKVEEPGIKHDCVDE